MRFGRGLVLVLGISFAACSGNAGTREWRPSDHSQPPGVAESPMPAQRAPGTQEEGSRRAGAALFLQKCASCHGESGRGDGPARSPGLVPTDLTQPAFQSSRSDQALMTVIATGRGAMPGFARELDEEGLVALVAHVRSLRAPAPDAPAPPAAPATSPAHAAP